jgi:hypothetical protein
MEKVVHQFEIYILLSLENFKPMEVPFLDFTSLIWFEYLENPMNNGRRLKGPAHHCTGASPSPRWAPHVDHAIAGMSPPIVSSCHAPLRQPPVCVASAALILCLRVEERQNNFASSLPARQPLPPPRMATPSVATDMSRPIVPPAARTALVRHGAPPIGSSYRGAVLRKNTLKHRVATTSTRTSSSTGHVRSQTTLAPHPRGHPRHLVPHRPTGSSSPTPCPCLRHRSLSSSVSFSTPYFPKSGYPLRQCALGRLPTSPCRRRAKIGRAATDGWREHAMEGDFSPARLGYNPAS